jgi:5-formyltetrahydrofolate cyclo-ligase
MQPARVHSASRLAAPPPPAGQAIAAEVLQLPAFASSSRVGIYITCERLREVDTGAILAAALQQGKRCYVPLVKDSNANMQLLHIDGLQDLHPAPPFGILEPAPSTPDGGAREDVLESAGLLDLLVMPGLGFDGAGGRLGRGGGYYDKFIGDLVARAHQLGRPPPLLLALAFREQLVEAVPMGPQDRRVDVLVLQDGAVSMM